MGLTVAEKEQYEKLIKEKVGQAIKRLKDENASFYRDIEAQARTDTIKELGIAEQVTRVEALHAEIAKLKEKREEMNVEIDKMVCKHPEFRKGRYYRDEPRWMEVVKAETDDRKNTLEMGTDIGKKVAMLEAEKDNARATMWLATSPKQVRELWEDLNRFLGDKSSELEKAALKTTPVD